MEDITKYNIIRIKDRGVLKEEDTVVIEYPFTIFLNDEEIITLLCSPNSLKELTIGFLHSEGLIDSISDIEKIILDKEKGIAYVYSKNTNRLNKKFHGKRTITSGCGKGTVFYNVVDSFNSKKIEDKIDITIKQIMDLIKEFNKSSQLFLDTGGVHSCALCDINKIIIFKEDIERHNALDKVLGKALLEDIDFKDKIILTSGRISSEILIKVAKRQIPVIVSRSAPTSLSIDIAKELNIILIGFARGKRMNIYSNFPTLKV